MRRMGAGQLGWPVAVAAVAAGQRGVGSGLRSRRVPSPGLGHALCQLLLRRWWGRRAAPALVLETRETSDEALEDGREDGADEEEEVEVVGTRGGGWTGSEIGGRRKTPCFRCKEN